MLVEIRMAVLGLAASIPFLSPAVVEARGFCNADHLGSEIFQSQVTMGGGSFYEAMSFLWQSFEQTENGNSKAAISTASDAAKSFSTAGEQYQAASKLIGGTLDKLLAGTDLKSVQELAGYVNADAGLLNDIVKNGAGSKLLEQCAALSMQLKDSVQEYIGALKETPEGPEVDSAMWKSLKSISFAADSGRYISIIFHVASKKQ
jgi:hypothetical protein